MLQNEVPQFSTGEGDDLISGAEQREKMNILQGMAEDPNHRVEFDETVKAIMDQLTDVVDPVLKQMGRKNEKES